MPRPPFALPRHALAAPRHTYHPSHAPRVACSAAYQTPDSKKEEFRKYLEKSGVIDALTKVLVGLYEEPERPPNAVDYIKRYMGAPTGLDVEAMKEENKALKEEVRLLKESVEELNGRLQEDADALAED
mgnify:FL=1